MNNTASKHSFFFILCLLTSNALYAPTASRGPYLLKELRQESTVTIKQPQHDFLTKSDPKHRSVMGPAIKGHPATASAPSESSKCDLITAPSVEGKDKLIHVAIIGGGPAGLSAAIPPSRSGYHTVVFQGPKPGGELMDAAVIENWPGQEKNNGGVCMQHLENQVTGLGAHLVPLTVVSIDLSTPPPFKLTLNDGTQVHALTVIIATGASQKKLGVKGEDIYWGNGLFSCGLCDASFTKDRDTAVIGGGDIAIQRALQLAPLARTVTLICPTPELTAHKTMQQKIDGLSQIQVLVSRELKAIEGDGAHITHVELYDPETKKTSTLNIESVFLSTGLTPNTETFKDQLAFDAHGCIELKEGRTQETSVKGVFAAGTVADPRYRQVAVIMGDGTKAAIDALKLLSSWGFDGVKRQTIMNNLYKPIKLPHPDIKNIENLYEFNRLMQKTKLPVLVEFYSPLCPTCKKMDLPLYEIAEKFKNMLKVLKVNKETLFNLIKRYNITIIPAFILFINGKEIDRIEGETTTNELIKLIQLYYNENR